MGSAPYWFPVVTLIVGALAGYFADYLREGRATERQRELSRRAFERETLLELQDCLAKLGRGAARIELQDMQAAKSSDPSAGRAPVASDASADFAAGARDVQRLKVRLQDDALRAEVEAFVKLCNAVALPSPRPGGASARWQDANRLPSAFTAVNERLGTAIRRVL